MPRLGETDKVRIPESVSSTCFTPPATCDCTASILSDQGGAETPFSSSIPWPGNTYIIRSVSTGRVITFRRGKVVLAPLNGHSAIRWECVEKDGWIGWRDPASHMYLGYDDDGDIRCSVRHQKEWEQFCVRQRPDGKYVLLMYHYSLGNKVWKGFCPVGISEEGVEKVTVLKDWKSDSVAWEFIKVESERD